MVSLSLSTDAGRRFAGILSIAASTLALGACGSSNRSSSAANALPVPDIETAHIASNANGEAIAVWQQFDGRQISIYARQYHPAGGWQAASPLETDDTGDATLPRIAMNADGTAFAVWQQSDGTRTDIYANRFDHRLGIWQGATAIESAPGDATLPEVAIDAQHNAFVVWQQSDGVRINVIVNRYINGLGWRLPTLLEADDAGDATRPRVAMNADGTAFAVWQQSDGARTNIWANRYDLSLQQWQGATPIEIDNTGHAERPDVAIDTAGNAFAVWQHFDGAVFNITANRYINGLGWRLPELLETDGAGDATRPRVAMNAGGSAFAIWQQSDGQRTNIRANRFDAAAVPKAWQGSAPVEFNASEAGHPDVAVDAAGNAVAVWQQISGLRISILKSRYAAGVGWGMAGLVETDEAGDAKNPRIAIDGHGNAFAVWLQSDGTRVDGQSARFTP